MQVVAGPSQTTKSLTAAQRKKIQGSSISCLLYSMLTSIIYRPKKKENVELNFPCKHERILYKYILQKKMGDGIYVCSVDGRMWMENVMIRWILKFLPIYFVDSIHHSSKWQSNLQQRNQQTNKFVVSFYIHS